MSLTDTAIKAIKPTGKAQKITDGKGLFLYVTPQGGKSWRMAYRFGGKQKTLCLGAYPAVSLKQARDKRDAAKSWLADGIDPSIAKKEAKVAVAAAAAVARQSNTFARVALQWLEVHQTKVSEKRAKNIRRRLEMYLFPAFGGKAIEDLEPQDILKAVQPAVAQGKIETASILCGIAGQVCRYARLMHMVKYNVADGLTEALPKKPERHFAAITDPAEVGHLLCDIDNYHGNLSVSYALKIMPYVFVRNTELRGAQWTEIDFDKALWTIPAARMKMKRPHVVPLARQALELFMELYEFTGDGVYCFPSTHSRTAVISDMGLLNALRRMGYARGTMTVHGFRSMASTLLNEQGFRADVIEMQLAHVEQNAVRAAYNHAEYLEERGNMMQRWADYLDGLRQAAKTGGNVMLLGVDMW